MHSTLRAQLLTSCASVGSPNLEELGKETFSREGPGRWQTFVPFTVREVWKILDHDMRMIAFLVAEDALHDSLGR